MTRAYQATLIYVSLAVVGVLTGCQAVLQIPNPEPPAFSESSRGVFGLASRFVVTGTAASSGTVEFYDNNQCSGNPLTSATGSEFKAGVTVPVVADQTRIYARVQNENRTSVCSTEYASYTRIWWTWMGGPEAPPYSRSYGTVGISSSTNTPGERGSARVVSDGVATFKLFGGDTQAGYGERGDLWSFDTKSLRWTWTSGSSSSMNSASYGTKGVPAPSNLISSRAAQSMWLMPNGDLYVWGGFRMPSGGERLADMWKYDSSTGIWTWVNGPNTPNGAGVSGTRGLADPANFPEPRNNAVTSTDADGNLWIFGGQGSTGDRQDVWKYNPSIAQWTWVTGSLSDAAPSTFGPSGQEDASYTPSGRYNSCNWSTPGYFWFYGGEGLDINGTRGLLSDLWRFNLKTGQWSYISGPKDAVQNGNYGEMGVSGTSRNPGGRRSFACWSDSKNRLWLFGGNGYGSAGTGQKPLADLWVYDLGTTQWTWMGGPNAGNEFSTVGTLGSPHSQNFPGARRNPAAATVNGNVWLYGGLGLGSSGGVVLQGDLWKIPVP